MSDTKQAGHDAVAGPVEPSVRPAAGALVFKVDAAEGEVRCVLGGPWPTVDSEGDICYDNTHFSTHRAALEKLRAECDAWLTLNFDERGRLHELLAALHENDKRARAGLQRALAGLAGMTPCAVRDGRCQSGGECQELGQCSPTACGCREGTCESKPVGCRMAAEIARRDPKAM